MGASPNTTGVLKRMANVDTEKHRGRDGQVKMKAEIRVMFYKTRNIKDGWAVPDTGREAWNVFSLSARSWNQPCLHLDFLGLPVSRTERQPISVVYSSWGFAMIAPEKTNTTSSTARLHPWEDHGGVVLEQVSLILGNDDTCVRTGDEGWTSGPDRVSVAK